MPSSRRSTSVDRRSPCSEASAFGPRSSAAPFGRTSGFHCGPGCPVGRAAGHARALAPGHGGPPGAADRQARRCCGQPAGQGRRARPNCGGRPRHSRRASGSGQRSARLVSACYRQVPSGSRSEEAPVPGQARKFHARVLELNDAERFLITGAARGFSSHLPAGVRRIGAMRTECRGCRWGACGRTASQSALPRQNSVGSGGP